jgi:hypothetical protein
VRNAAGNKTVVIGLAADSGAFLTPWSRSAPALPP